MFNLRITDARKRAEAALSAISRRRSGLVHLKSVTEVLAKRYDLRSVTEERARLLLFAKFDELARDAESDNREIRNQARIAILGFVMLLERIAAESQP